MAETAPTESEPPPVPVPEFIIDRQQLLIDRQQQRRAVLKAAPISGSCTRNCGYAKTWHHTHCCNACKNGLAEHGDLCARVPVAELMRAPANGRCAGCGYKKTWHESHCCMACKCGNKNHGSLCAQLLDEDHTDNSSSAPADVCQVECSESTVSAGSSADTDGDTEETIVGADAVPPPPVSVLALQENVTAVPSVGDEDEDHTDKSSSAPADVCQAELSESTVSAGSSADTDGDTEEAIVGADAVPPPPVSVLALQESVPAVPSVGDEDLTGATLRLRVSTNEFLKAVPAWGVCRGGCGYAKTWGRSHCCHACRLGGPHSHDDMCAKLPVKTLKDFPPSGHCARGCGFMKTWHQTHCCNACWGGMAEHGPACARLPVQVSPSVGGVNPLEAEDGLGANPLEQPMTFEVQLAPGEGSVKASAGSGFEMLVLASPSDPCPRGCGFAKDARKKYCCGVCGDRTKTHGPNCAQVPIQALKEFPPTGKCAGACGFRKTWHSTHCCNRCYLGLHRHGEGCAQLPVEADGQEVSSETDSWHLLEVEEGSDTKPSAQPVAAQARASVDEDAQLPASESSAPNGLELLVRASPSDPCPGCWKFVRTAGDSYCCRGCGEWPHTHGPDCTQVPVQALTEVPPMGKCAGGCGFQRTWHRTHCCNPCALGLPHHGPACAQIPVVANDKEVEDDWELL